MHHGDATLEHILSKTRDAKNGGFGALSTGEKLAAALVLNRADWLAGMDYTIAEAIERVGHEWVSLIPTVAQVLACEPDADEIKAMAAIGREPGAVGDNEAGQLVKRQADGSLRVIEDRQT